MRVSTLLILLFLVGCAQVKTKSSVDQRIGVSLTAGIGDAVYSSTSKKNLPNAFGKADLFGRSTPTGKTNVIYYGVRNDMAIFIRKTTDIETGATTMNSTPIIIGNSSTTTHSGQVGGSYYSGTSYTHGPTVVLPPDTPNPQYFEREGLLIELPLNELPGVFVVEGTTVTVREANSVIVTYIIEKKSKN